MLIADEVRYLRFLLVETTLQASGNSTDRGVNESAVNMAYPQAPSTFDGLPVGNSSTKEWKFQPLKTINRGRVLFSFGENVVQC